jgi:hypothetical protein
LHFGFGAEVFQGDRLWCASALCFNRYDEKGKGLFFAENAIVQLNQSLTKLDLKFFFLQFRSNCLAID